MFRLFILFLLVSSCSSYEQFERLNREFELPNSIFKSNYAQTWAAVSKVMANYDLAVQNQETGVIKTKWIDNTLEMNFADSFSRTDAIKAARYKVIASVTRGFRYGREVSKVTVYKRQLVENDALHGWRIADTDGIFEKTLLYRFNREILIDNKLKKIEEQKQKEQEANF